MLTTALLDLLPEVIELSHHQEQEFSALPIFLGVIIFFFLERFVLWFHHHDDTHQAKPTVYMILIGDGIHNFIDGVAIAAAFMTDIRLGIITTLAIAAHEIPQELADFAVLLHSGLTKKKALLFNFLSGLTAILGSIMTIFVFSAVNSIVPVLLGFTTGMFLYIALSDLIPELHQSFSKTSRWLQSLPFLIGAGSTLLLIQLFGHGH
jgi:zinc and cadmium transporter